MCDKSFVFVIFLPVAAEVEALQDVRNPEGAFTGRGLPDTSQIRKPREVSMESTDGKLINRIVRTRQTMFVRRNRVHRITEPPPDIAQKKR